MILALLCIDTKSGLVRRYTRASNVGVVGVKRRLDHSAVQIPADYLGRMDETLPLLEHYRKTGTQVA